MASLTIWQKIGDRIAYWIFVNLWTPGWPDWLGLWLVQYAGRYAYEPQPKTE